MIYAIQFLVVVLVILTTSSNAFQMPSSRGGMLMRPLRMALESKSNPTHLRVGIFGGLIARIMW